jgi:hypothetical protein
MKSVAGGTSADVRVQSPVARDPSVSVEEVAVLLGVTPRRVRALIGAGWLHAAR